MSLNGHTNELPPIVGESRAIKEAIWLLRRCAPTRLGILLVGATGTGKELFAQHAHSLSGRRGQLVDVDCGALPRDTAEALLFGWHRGAFTGAVEDRVGLIEESNSGTLFLDELLGLSDECQRKLLRVLESSQVRRLGETNKRAVDFRIVAAVQEDAATQLSRGGFRRDLYERVAGVVIHLPPLAERPEDILPLIRYFAQSQGQRLGEGAELVLRCYSWPGNIRELKKVIERAAFLVPDGVLPPAALAQAIELGAPSPPGARRDSLADRIAAEREALLAACQANGWNAGRTAAAVGVGRTTLFKRLRMCGLSLKDGMSSRVRGSSPNSG